MATVPSSDASSPAVVKVNNNATTVSSATFTAPANSRVVVGFTSDADASSGSAPVCDDTTSGVPFTLDPNSRGYGGAGHDVGLAALFVSSKITTSTSITVRVTHNRGAVTKPRMMIVRVYTADQVDVDDPIGAVVSGSFASGTTLEATVTPETTDGGLRMMWLDWNATGQPTTFRPNNTVTELVDAYHNASLSTNVQIGKSTRTAAGVPEVIGATLLAAATDGNFIAYELRAPSIVGPAFDSTAFDSTTFWTSGATSTSSSTSEALTTGDSSSARVTRARTAAEALAIADATVRTSSRTRTAGEGVTLADVTSAAVIRTIPRSTTETLTIADSTSRTTSAQRGLAEALAIADATVRTSSRTRTAGEALTLVDAAARTTSTPRSTTEPLGLADAAAASVTGQISRTTSEALTASDATARRTTAPRTVSEALTASDSPSRRLTRPRAAAEGITLVDVTSRTAPARARSTAETLTTSDTSASSTTGQIIRTGSESLVLVDVASRRLTRPRTVAEALQVIDTVARRTTGPRSAGEALQVVDVTARQVTAPRLVLEALVLVDTAGAALGLPAVDVVVLAPPVGRQRRVDVGDSHRREVDLGSRPPDPAHAGRRRTVTITGRPHEEHP